MPFKKICSKLCDLLNQILNLIIPKDPGISEIENVTDTILDDIPSANEIANGKYKALFQYRNKISKKAIWAIKYCKNEKILRIFCNRLYDYILDNISDEIIFSNFSNPILIAIPMHKKNLKERGYNQSELIVKEIYKIDNGKNFVVNFDALLKIKETKHQSTLKNKNERLKNLKGCFSANSDLVKNRNIILIDDVITTGTTMSEASKTLREAGAKKVIGFSLTH